MADAQVRFFNGAYEPVEIGPVQRFSFTCPNGNVCGGLLIRDPADERHPSWVWDGDRLSPTFEPSINCKGCWHGYIRAGRTVAVDGSDEPGHGGQ